MMRIYQKGWARYAGLPWYWIVIMFIVYHTPVWHENQKTGKKSIKFARTADLQDMAAGRIL